MKNTHSYVSVGFTGPWLTKCRDVIVMQEPVDMSYQGMSISVLLATPAMTNVDVVLLVNSWEVCSPHRGGNSSFTKTQCK